MPGIDTGSASRRRRARLSICLVMASAVASASACGVAARTKSLFGADLQMSVEVSSRLNDAAPVAVDVVVVYQRELLDRLVALSAREWMEQRAQLQRDHKKDLQVWSWEWIPGQEVGRQTLSFSAGAAGGLVFADYDTPGAHRERIDPHQHFHLVLGDSSFAIAPLKQN